MKSFAIAAALVGAVVAAPQGVTSAIAPKETTPAGCSTNYDGQFQISVENVTTSNTKRDLSKRQSVPLELNLKNSVLTDAKGRTGYIASNNQFQFDGPVQAGAIYTAGFSVCSNGSLALGDSAVFYQCLSGTFYNLYDENDAAQCSPVYINVVGGTTSPSASVAIQQADGQVTAAPISQIKDGQIQASTGVNVVSQISDGQIQATTGVAVVSQISDGQIQVPTATPAVVSQISDGQIQAPTTAAAVVSQIGDGQIQAPTGAVVSQISDGQIQAPTNGTRSTTASPSAPVQFTGAASQLTLRAELFGLAAGVLALAAL